MNNSSSSIKDFEIQEKLGEGVFSQVYKVKRKTDNMIYAMKIVKIHLLNEKEKTMTLNEVRILASINDPNIIAYKEAFYDSNSMNFCVIMEHANNGDLQSKIQQAKKNCSLIDENLIWQWTI